MAQSGHLEGNAVPAEAAGLRHRYPLTPMDNFARWMRESGPYVGPDALDLVDIDQERNRGTCEETNLWMQRLKLQAPAPKAPGAGA